jgi:hypothetical protein
MTDGPIADLAARLEEIAADAGEHDKTLMAIIRRGARDGAVPVPEPGETATERQLELVDRAGAVYEKLSSPERRLFDAFLKSSLERRRHLAFLLSLPDDDREAVAFVLSLDEHQRAQLARHAETTDGDGTDDA